MSSNTECLLLPVTNHENTLQVVLGRGAGSVRTGAKDRSARREFISDVGTIGTL